jgi:hypothetical protein
MFQDNETAKVIYLCMFLYRFPKTISIFEAESYILKSVLYGLGQLVELRGRLEHLKATSTLAKMTSGGGK